MITRADTYVPSGCKINVPLLWVRCFTRTVSIAPRKSSVMKALSDFIAALDHSSLQVYHAFYIVYDTELVSVGCCS